MVKKTTKPGRTAGLTDDPKQRKLQQGDPEGFRVVRRFRNEGAAREWEEGMLEKGYDGGAGGAGWQFGYTFKTSRKSRKRPK